VQEEREAQGTAREDGDDSHEGNPDPAEIGAIHASSIVARRWTTISAS
jgi:hypothetical protein